MDHRRRVIVLGATGRQHRGVPTVVSRTRLAAEPRAVAGLLRDVDVAASALGRLGHRLRADRRLLVPGAEVRVGVRLAPGLRVPLRTVVESVSAGGLTSSLVRGPLRALWHETSLVLDGSTTEVHDALRWRAPAGAIADPLLVRRLMSAVLRARAEELGRRVAALADLTVVVATAIVRDGRVLAARRTRPAALAGRWELPGGRVEPGESEAAAVVRECREELGVVVVPGGRVATDLPIDAGLLRIHAARLAPGSAEPVAREHAALRWLGPAELDTVDWIDADRAAIDDLRDVLVVTRDKNSPY